MSNAAEQEVMNKYFKTIMSPEDIVALEALQKNIWKRTLEAVPPPIPDEQSSEQSELPTA